MRIIPLLLLFSTLFFNIFVVFPSINHKHILILQQIYYAYKMQKDLHANKKYFRITTPLLQIILLYLQLLHGINQTQNNMKSVLLIDDKESIGKVVSIYVGKDYDFTFF
eukprot:TRINITY_DN5957_c0_g1_i2.p3 TRINITY_DN5957_c0_g1~~TRINITY_DN5957_c0_g1_i2.p3  ORF type:complete len:109 (-),score=3.95 TRINITY_DN5957_c0_g1_i2:329-655(-)